GRDRLRLSLSRPVPGALSCRLGGGLRPGLTGPYRGQVTDNRDLVTVMQDFRLALEPVIRQTAEEPAAHLLGRTPAPLLLPRTHVIMITHNAQCRNAPGPRAPLPLRAQSQLTAPPPQPAAPHTLPPRPVHPASPSASSDPATPPSAN